MEVKWIEYKGKKILYADYRGTKTEDEMLSLLKEQTEIMKNLNEKILVLTNYTGTFATQKYLDEVKKFGIDVGNFKISKSAIIGIEGMKKFLFKVYLAFTKEKNILPFNDENDAKEWLVS